MSNEDKKKIQLLQEEQMDQEQSLYELELGEYFLHIFIQETTSVQLSDEADLMMKIKAFGEEKLTNIIKEQGPGSKTYWGAHFFFNKKFEQREDLENSNFEIDLIDYNSVLRNEFLGRTQGSIHSVYKGKKHQIVNKWSILVNTDKINSENSGFMGFIKYSISFTRANEPRINLEDAAQKDQSKTTQLTIPANIQMKKKQLVIKVYKAENITSHDGSGYSDPYIQASLGGLQIQTKVCEKTLNPYFYQKLLMPTLYPTISENLKISVLDRDEQMFNSDDFIGSIYLNLNEIEKNSYKLPRWIQLYGSHYKVKEDKIAEKMNEFPEIGSTFKGRVLMSVEILDSEQTAFAVQDMSQEDENLQSTLKLMTFQAQINVEFVQNVEFEAGEKQKVCFNWGGDVKQSKISKKNHNNVLVFQEKIIIEKDFQISPKEQIYDQIPDLIMTLSDDDEKNHYSFYRFKSKDFLLTRQDYQKPLIIQMKADNAISDLKQYQAGLAKVSLAISEKNDFQSLGENSWHFQPQLKFEKIKIICYMFQGKDLIAGDQKGTSDTNLLFYHLGSTIRSMTFPNSLNPCWNQKVILNSYIYNGSIPQMIIKVCDKDSSEYEFIGQSIVDLTTKQIAQKKEDLWFCRDEKWYDIYFDKEEKAGSLLLGFTVIRNSSKNDLFQKVDELNLADKSVTIPIPKKKFHIKISALGFRNLQSTGILPVRRTKLKINTSSLQNMHFLQEGSAFSDLIAYSKNSGPDPSIGTVLNLNAQLPSSIGHMPSISCEVIDSGIHIFSNSLIGSFPISTGAFAYVSNQVLLQKLEVLLDKEQKLIDLHPTSEKHMNNLIILKELVCVLKQQLQQNENLIRQMSESLFEQAKRKTSVTIDLNITQQEREVGSRYGFDIIERGPPEEQSTTVQMDFPEIRPNTQLKLKGENPNNDFEVKVKKDEMVFEGESVEMVEIDGEDQVQESGFVKREQIKESALVMIQKEICQNKGVEIEEYKMADPSNKKEKIIERMEENLEVVISPQYREVVKLGRTYFIEEEKPDCEKYMELGFKSKLRNTKHYRLQLNDELENSIYMGDEIFSTIKMFRGKKLSFQKESFISRLLGMKQENYHETGLFRGNVQIIEDEVLQKLGQLKISDEDKQILDIPQSIQEWKQNKLDHELLKSVKVMVRIYVIDAQFYQSLDYDSENDSFLVLKLGDKTITEKNVQQDNNRPKFYKCYQFEHVFPGPSNLNIQFFDQDIMKPDNIIGETNIDVERRFFDQTWRNQQEIPIETRKLKLPSQKQAMGSVRLWVDIKKLNEIKPQLNISPRPKTNLELRIIVWEIWDVPHMDIEEVSDLFVRVSLPSFDLSMNTDTHYRSQNGFGSFNWRTKFKLTIDQYSKPEMMRANFRIYDKDLLSPNDFHSDVTLDLQEILNNVLNNEQRESMYGDGKEGEKKQKCFVLSTTAKPGKNSKKIPKIMVSVDCLTEKEAENSPVGIGRGDPNQDPFLPSPSGRFQWSLNPLKLLNQLVGPGFRNKMCLIIFMIFLVVFLLVLGPGLLSTILGNLIV